MHNTLWAQAHTPSTYYKNLKFIKIFPNQKLPFKDKEFDYVILSQTLQAFYNPEKVIDDLLKISNKAIVTIPNFGYWKVRLHLLLKGTMPITKNLPNEWYNTPNLHMCTIKDFYNFCSKKNIELYKSIALNGEKTSQINKINLNIKKGVEMDKSINKNSQ